MIRAFEAALFYIQPREWASWHSFVVVSLVLYGLYQFAIDRLVSEPRIEDAETRSRLSFAAISGMSLTVTGLAGAVVLVNGWAGAAVVAGPVELLETGILGLLQGVLFLLLNLLRFRARRHLPQQVVLPVTKLSVLVVIVLSWTLFDEFTSLTGPRLTGFCLVAISIHLLREPSEEVPEVARGPLTFLVRPGVVELVLAMLASAGIALLAKYAVGPSNLDIGLFMFSSNFFTCVAALLLWRRARKRAVSRGPVTAAQAAAVERPAFRRGLALGIVNLVAYWTLLAALAVGDASVVIPIHSLHIMIAVLLATLLDGERLTNRGTIGLILSVLAVIVLK